MVNTPTKSSTIKSKPVIDNKSPCKLSMKLKEQALPNDMSVSDFHRRQTGAKKNVNRLRKYMPEKLTLFCKMHLSSLLELDGSKMEDIFIKPDVTENNHKKKPTIPFASSKKEEKPSGAAITKDCVNQIYKLFNYLQKSDNLQTEGLFRKTGNISRQRMLKDWIMQGLDLNFMDTTFSAHDIATVLKQTLSDLPEPLLTQKYFEAYLKIGGLVRDTQTEKERLRANEKQLNALQLMTLLLPRENVILLQGLLDLLHQVASIAENKMSTSSLGVVFAPNILCPRKMSPEELRIASARVGKTIAMMIDNAPQMFTIPHELGDEVANFWKEMETPNMVDKDDSDNRANIQKSKYANVQSMPESVKQKKLIKQFNRVGSIQNSARKGYHSRSRSFGEYLKKHFPLRNKANQRYMCSSEEPEVDQSLTKPVSIDDTVSIISYNKTQDVTCMSFLTHSPDVHIVDRGTSPCNVKHNKRLGNENLDNQMKVAKLTHLEKEISYLTKHMYIHVHV